MDPFTPVSVGESKVKSLLPVGASERAGKGDAEKLAAQTLTVRLIPPTIKSAARISSRPPRGGVRKQRMREYPIAYFYTHGLAGRII